MSRPEGRVGRKSLPLGRTPSTGGALESAAAEVMDRARAHFQDAARLTDRPVAWSCAVAAGLALIEAVEVLAGDVGTGLGTGLYHLRFGCAPWDDHGPPPLAVVTTASERDRVTARRPLGPLGAAIASTHSGISA